MGLLDNISDGMRRGGESLGRTTESANLRMRSDKLLRQRQALAAQLGASLYEQTRNDPALRAGREELFDGIAAVDQERADIEARIEQLAREAEQARQRAVTYRCPRCGSTVSAADKFCFGCGLPVEEIARAYQPPVQPAAGGSAGFCANCGSPLRPGDAFCMSCGAPVGGATPGAAPAPMAEPVPAPVAGPAPVAEPAPVPVDTSTPVPAPVAEPVGEPASAPEVAPVGDPEPPASEAGAAAEDES